MGWSNLLHFSSNKEQKWTYYSGNRSRATQPWILSRQDCSRGFIKMDALQKKGEKKSGEAQSRQKRQMNKGDGEWEAGHSRLTGKHWKKSMSAEQFYTPTVSHLRSQPLPTLNLVSPLCVFIYSTSLSKMWEAKQWETHPKCRSKQCVK